MRQANLQQAADAAAVGAVSRTSPGYEAALQMTADGPIADSVTKVNTQGLFDANFHKSGETTVSSVSGSACSGATLVCKTGTVVSSVVTVNGTFAPNFLGLIGQHSIKLSLRRLTPRTTSRCT